MMSSLVSKTRVSWAFVVVTLNGSQTLHIIKKSYRGKLTYYSKSARGVTDKVGFGEVMFNTTTNAEQFYLFTNVFRLCHARQVFARRMVSGSIIWSFATVCSK